MSDLLNDHTRAVVLSQVTSRLRSKFDQDTALLGISLLDDTTLSEDLISTLIDHALRSDEDDVAGLIKHKPKVAELVLRSVLLSLSSTNQPPENEKSNAEDRTIRQLRLTRRLLTNDSPADSQSLLLTTSFKLLQSQHRQTAIAARETISVLISATSNTQRSEQIRSSVNDILSSNAASWQRALAYSLWLYQLIHDPASTNLAYLKREDYFTQIAYGLQFGDTECRKLCLEILRSSVAVVLANDSVALISNDTATDPAAIASQYARYCTVFETLVLARYANLVAECQNDLQQMLSGRSMLPDIWLLTLFNTALDSKTSDQSRKFVGKWLLSGSIKILSFDILQKLLAQSFLPWVCDGSLFVASTNIGADEKLHCQHGEQVSKLIQDLFQSATNTRVQELFDTFNSYLRGDLRRTYPYAIAYIFHGLLMSVRARTTLILSEAQAKVLNSFDQWAGLPEAPRLFLRRACTELIERCASTSEDAGSALNDTRLDDETLPKLETRVGSSQRISKIRNALEKCSVVLKRPNIEPGPLLDLLDDIWSDAEYLEYPRELMMTIPKSFFDKSVIETALETGGGQLQQLLRRTLTWLQDMTAHRTYLLAPIVESIRKAVIAVPSTAQFLPVSELIIYIAENEPSPGVDLQMEYAALWLFDVLAESDQATAREYFGKGERYGYALLYDLVSRLRHDNQQTSASVLSHIIKRWRKQKIPAPTMSPLKTTLQLQILIICFENLDDDDITTFNDGKLVQDFYWLLSVEPLPRYRYLLAWLILRYHTRIPETRHIMLDTLTTENNHSPNPKYLASLMKLSVEYCMTNAADESFALHLATTFIALSASPKIIVRHEAQWSFPLFMDLARERDWNQISDNVAFVALDNYIRSLPRFDDPPPDRVNARFTPETQHTITNLVEGTWTELDYTGPPFARRADFVDIEKQDALDGLSGLTTPSIDIGEPVLKSRGRTETVEAPSPDNILGGKQMSLEEAIALQTKGSAYLRTMIQGEDAERSRSSTVIIIGSLIDNAFNLGGLSRVGEIFGARALYLKDPRVIAEKEFMSTAVSSYNHLDIMPLAVEDLPAFLTEKKADGWTCLGVEQTDRSEVLGLDTTKLPSKAVLIIGNERQGIPGDVLAHCDMLIEIPQRGITRSLNVQTVAAVTLFEYNRQMPSK